MTTQSSGPRGWFAVPRDHWLWGLSPDYFRVAMQLLREANWRESRVVIDGDVVVVPRGSCLTSRAGLAERSGVTVKRARTAVTFLERENFLTRKRANTGARAPTLISIVNYDAWRPMSDEEGQQVGQHRANIGPTSGQRAGHIRTSNKGTKKQTPEDFPIEVKQLAWSLARAVAERYPESRNAKPEAMKANGIRWCKPISLLHSKDGYSYDLIGQVLAWSQADTFWQKNIRSGAKFKSQFEELLAKSKADRANTAPPNETVEQRNARLYPGMTVIRGGKPQ